MSKREYSDGECVTTTDEEDEHLVAVRDAYRPPLPLGAPPTSTGAPPTLTVAPPLPTSTPHTEHRLRRKKHCPLGAASAKDYLNTDYLDQSSIDSMLEGA